jgi:hypothetical protein
MLGALSVADVWKMWEWSHGLLKGSSNEKRARVEAWLDAVYADAERLAEIWTEVVTKEMADCAGVHEGLGMVLKKRRVLYGNLTINARLRTFYEAASAVLSSDSPFDEQFLDQLASVLLTRDKLFTFLKLGGAETAVAGEGDKETIDKLTIELRHHVGVLQATIITFKAARHDSRPS